MERIERARFSQNAILTRGFENASARKKIYLVIRFSIQESSIKCKPELIAIGDRSNDCIVSMGCNTTSNDAIESN